MFSTSGRFTAPKIRAACSRASRLQGGSGSYGILEMQVDADGNDLAGIRSVFLQTPIGTYIGWNLGPSKDRFENGIIT